MALFTYVIPPALSLLLLLLLANVLCDDATICDEICECQIISPNQITVHCARKSLPSIPWDIPADVTYLDVSYNNIAALDGATIGVFDNLKKLDLRNNLVSRIDSWAFQKLSALEELDLDNNLIQVVTPYMFSTASNLKILSLGNNAISKIEHSAFIHLSLDSLNLRDNRKLKSLDSAVFSQSGVNTLILDGCGIRDIDGYVLRPVAGTLKVLSLSNMVNGLLFHSGALSSLHLDILQLVGNSLEPADLDFLTVTLNAKSLDLSMNKVGRLDMSVLRGLHGTESLIMKRCHVNEILADGEPAPNLARIRELDLSGNALTSFPVQVFRWLPGLRNLNVADNPISSFSESAGQILDRLESLDISNVSLSCGCPLRWFAQWRNATRTLVIGDLCAAESRMADGKTRCSAPHQLTAWVESRPDDTSSSFDIYCTASGNPAPRIQLALIQNSKDNNDSLLAVANQGHLHFTTSSRGCSGYTCTATNNIGNETVVFHVCPSGYYYWTERPDHVDEQTTGSWIHVWILTIILAIVLFLLLVIFAVICIKRRRRRTRFKTRLRMNSVDQANPDETTGSHMILMKCSRNEDEILNSG